MDTSAPKFVNAMLLMALAVALAACSLIPGTRSTKSGSTAKATGPQKSSTSATPAEQPVSPTQPPAHPPALSAQAQAATPTPTAKPPPATAIKGAEKLVAPTTPSIAAVKQAPSVQAATPPPSKSSIPAAQSDPATGVETVPGTSPKELVFKGPPRQVQPKEAGRGQVLWFGLCICGAACGVGGWIYVQRRAQSVAAAKAGKDDLITPDGFILKEPKNPRSA